MIKYLEFIFSSNRCLGFIDPFKFTLPTNGDGHIETPCPHIHVCMKRPLSFYLIPKHHDPRSFRIDLSQNFPIRPARGGQRAVDHHAENAPHGPVKCLAHIPDTGVQTGPLHQWGGPLGDLSNVLFRAVARTARSAAVLHLLQRPRAPREHRGLGLGHG